MVTNVSEKQPVTYFFLYECVIEEVARGTNDKLLRGYHSHVGARLTPAVNIWLRAQMAAERVYSKSRLRYLPRVSFWVMEMI